MESENKRLNIDCKKTELIDFCMRNSPRYEQIIEYIRIKQEDKFKYRRSVLIVEENVTVKSEVALEQQTMNPKRKKVSRNTKMYQKQRQKCWNAI